MMHIAFFDKKLQKVWIYNSVEGKCGTCGHRGKVYGSGSHGDCIFCWLKFAQRHSNQWKFAIFRNTEELKEAINVYEVVVNL